MLVLCHCQESQDNTVFAADRCLTCKDVKQSAIWFVQVKDDVADLPWRQMWRVSIWLYSIISMFMHPHSMYFSLYCLQHCLYSVYNLHSGLLFFYLFSYFSASVCANIRNIVSLCFDELNLFNKEEEEKPTFSLSWSCVHSCDESRIYKYGREWWRKKI